MKLIDEIKDICNRSLNDLSGCSSNKDESFQYQWALEDILKLIAEYEKETTDNE